MTYNITNISLSNDLYTYVYTINNLSNNFLSWMMIVSIFLILFVSFRRYIGDSKDVMIFSSFLTLVVVILMWSVDLAQWLHITILLFILMGTILLKFMEG